MQFEKTEDLHRTIYYLSRNRCFRLKGHSIWMFFGRWNVCCCCFFFPFLFAITLATRNKRELLSAYSKLKKRTLLSTSDYMAFSSFRKTWMQIANNMRHSFWISFESFSFTSVSSHPFAVSILKLNSKLQRKRVWIESILLHKFYLDAVAAKNLREYGELQLSAQFHSVCQFCFSILFAQTYCDANCGIRWQ